MAAALDLDAYFNRIGWGGETRNDLATVAGLLRAHMHAIPFENLDVLLGRGVRLDLDGLQRKIVQQGRGGYCFEHATLFAAVLEALGFKPVRHTARVTLFLSRKASPRTHMVLVVTLPEGRFVLDPGFGGLAPTMPVALVATDGAAVEGRSHWFVRDGVYWVLRARAEGKDVECWATTLDADNLIDFEVGNHFTATHPASPFRNRLMMRALTPDGRVTVLNRDMKRWRGETVETLQLLDRGALRALLADFFGFDLPEVEALRVPMIPEWG